MGERRERAGRRTLGRRGRSALLWSVAFFAGGQLSLSLALHGRWTDLRDPEYACRMTLLREQLATQPGRPLVVVLGNSRVVLGVRPDALAPLRTADGREPLVFNFGRFNAGPLTELLSLNRLLADGVRPDWLVVECWPPLWCEEKALIERRRWQVLEPGSLRRCDLPVLCRYVKGHGALYRRWAATCLLPGYANRLDLLQRLAPDWLPTALRERGERWQRLDRTGWLTALPSLEDRPYPQRVDLWRRNFEPLLARYRLAGESARALREIGEVCRRERIGLALLLLPEGTEFRGWYPPAVLAQTEELLRRLAGEIAAPVIDARAWMDDADFCDSFHLTAAGAARFSERLGHEALQPFVEGSRLCAKAEQASSTSQPSARQ